MKKNIKLILSMVIAISAIALAGVDMLQYVQHIHTVYATEALKRAHMSTICWQGGISVLVGSFYSYVVYKQIK